MEQIEPFSITIQMFGLYNSGNTDSLFSPSISTLFIEYSFSLTLLIALIVLLIPNRFYTMRHLILLTFAFLSVPSLAFLAFVSLWVYSCIESSVVYAAFAFVILLTLALFLLSRRYEKTSRMHAFLRILSVWLPIPFVMFLVELISYLIGYQICVA